MRKLTKHCFSLLKHVVLLQKGFYELALRGWLGGLRP